LEREGIEAKPSEIRIAEFVLQQLQKAGQGPGGTVNIHLQNSRFLGSDADAMRRRVTNGESARDRDREG